MKKIVINKWIIIVLVLLSGIVIGKYFLGGNTSNVQEEIAHNHSETEGAIWTCSMHPQIQQDHAGQCPLCGMDLIQLDNLLYREDLLPDEVQMSIAAVKLAEIQTYVVKKAKPEKELRLLGKVKADERLKFSQAIHFPGRIEKLYINFTGEKVAKGQRLATVYSAELVTAQKELFEVLKDESTNPALVEATRNKLKQWKFTDEQIATLEASGKVQTEVDILSDYSGYVMNRKISEGDHIKEGQILFEIINLNKVWVLFEAYENDLPWIKIGDKLTINLKSIPGKMFTGKVTFIDPFINPTTRVAYVRVELQNKNGKLKPDMFADGIITSKLPIEGEVILVPKSAVLWTGKRAVVYIKLPNRKHSSFIYREVILGEDAGDYYIVKSGLAEGDEIASNGVFKIDASAQLAGKKSMMNPTGGKSSTGHNHTSDGNKEMNMADMKMEDEVAIDKAKISSKFKKQLGNVVSSYLAIKYKLTQDDSDVLKEVKVMQKAVSKVDMSLVLEDAHNEWMKALKSINIDLKRLSKSINIEEQRAIFLTISQTLSITTQKLGVEMNNEQMLYLYFCPMANNNNGGYWLSTDKNVINPYFGQKMLSCGELKNTLTN